MSEQTFVDPSVNINSSSQQLPDLPPPVLDGFPNIEKQEADDTKNSEAAAQAAQAAAAVASGETPTTTPSSIKNLPVLGQYFGLGESDLTDTGKATETIRPYIDALIEAGSQQPTPWSQQEHTTGTVSTAPVEVPEEFKPYEIDFDSEEFEDAPPSLIKAMKQMNEQANRALKAASDRASAAEKASKDKEIALTQQQQQAYNAQQMEVSKRAYSHLDSLSSPKYGNAQNRTMMQKIAVQKVMNTADMIIRGMTAYGGEIPTIETIVDAAIIKLEGSVSASPSSPPQVALPINAHQRQAFPSTPASPVVRSGSAGSGGPLMSDAQYMAGARAILSR